MQFLKAAYKFSLFCIAICIWTPELYAQCTGIIGNFTIAPALPGCNAPLTITMTNTSTGAQSNTTGFYLWFLMAGIKETKNLPKAVRLRCCGKHNRNIKPTQIYLI